MTTGRLDSPRDDRATLSDAVAATVRDLAERYNGDLLPVTALRQANLAPTPENEAAVEAIITAIAKGCDDHAESDDCEPEGYETTTNPGAASDADSATESDHDEDGAGDDEAPARRPSMDSAATDVHRALQHASAVGGEAMRHLDYGDCLADAFPANLAERERWMGATRDKRPFSPWADSNAPAPCSRPGHTTAAECECDARFKWGYEGNYRRLDAVRMGLVDPNLIGAALVTTEDDDVVVIDGDNVVNPATNEVHPAFLDLVADLGLTYASTSSSQTGLHLPYRGMQPAGAGSAPDVILDDEPWGANDEGELPKVEFFFKRQQFVLTGEQVVGTPDRAQQWDEAAVVAFLKENDAWEGVEEQRKKRERKEQAATVDLSEYEPSATTAAEVTGDKRDVWAALDRLDPGDLGLRTNHTGTADWELFDPAYRESDSGKSLHRAPDGTFHDKKTDARFGIAGLLAAEEGITRDPEADLSGKRFIDVLAAARRRGADIPLYVPNVDDGYERSPRWALIEAAFTLNLCHPDDLREKETTGDDGDPVTWQALPPEAYNATLDALTTRGVNHGRSRLDGYPATPSIRIREGLSDTASELLKLYEE